MEPLVLNCVILTLLVVRADFSAIPKSCTANFNVWTADSDIAEKFKFIENKCENASLHVENELLRLKNRMLTDFICCKNETRGIEDKLIEFKNYNVRLDLSLKDLQIEIVHLKKDNERMIGFPSRDDASKAVKDEPVKNYPSLPQTPKHQSGACDVGHQYANAIQQLQNNLSLHTNSVGDLKAELLLIRRDTAHRTMSIMSLVKEQEDMKYDVVALKEQINALDQAIKSKYWHSSKDKGIVLLPESGGNDVYENRNRDSPNAPVDCQEVYQRGNHMSGVYYVRPRELVKPERVYCDMFNGTGWTVIQRRIDGTLSFNKGWLPYKYGFGNPYGEFWLGNEFIHHLSTQNEYLLRVDMWGWEGQYAYADYNFFRIGSEDEDYQLSARGFSGNAGDSLSYHDGMAFSTVDKDNDEQTINCAAQNKGGWWYKACFNAHLNGLYHAGYYQGVTSYADGIVWFTLKETEYYSLKKVEMKIRPYY